MRLILVALTLIMAGFAGCADAPTTVPDDDLTGERDEPGLEKPDWAVGDWWEYQSADTDGFTLAVSAETATSWIVDTDDDTVAFYEDQFGPLSYMGEQSKDALAGSQGSDAVRFFEWPLEDGKSWTTPWDGETMTITAYREGDDRFRMDAVAGGTLRAQYGYHADTGWFEYLEFFGPFSWRMDLVDSGSGFSGELIRIDATLIDARTGQAGVSSTTYPPFNAGDDADLFLYYSASCPEMAAGNGAFYTFALGPVENIPSAANEGLASNDDGFTDVGTCPHAEIFNGTIGWDPNAGTWGFLVEAPLEAQWSFLLYLREFERISI